MNSALYWSMPWVVKQQWQAHSSALQPIIKKGFMEACKSVLSSGGLHNKSWSQIKAPPSKGLWVGSEKPRWRSIPTTSGTTPALLCGWQLHERREHRIVHGMKSASKADWSDEQILSRMWSQSSREDVKTYVCFTWKRMRLGITWCCEWERERGERKKGRRRQRMANEMAMMAARGGANLSEGWG